jgi:hypothetical protein
MMTLSLSLSPSLSPLSLSFSIMVWIHMDAHEYVFFFQNLNILCIFSDYFFDPVFFRIWFGSGFWVNQFNNLSGSGNYG